MTHRVSRFIGRAFQSAAAPAGSRRAWLARRLPTVAMALLLAIMTVVPGSGPAQAQPPGPIVEVGNVSMYVDPNHAVLCVKQSKIFTISLKRSVTVTQNGVVNPGVQPYPPARVGIDNSNAVIGNALQIRRAAQVQVRFTANKIGATTLTFSAIVYPNGKANPQTVSKTMPVTVVDCHYKVSLVVDWDVQRLDQERHFMGYMDPVPLAPGTSDVLTGSGTVRWMEDIVEGCCTVQTKPRVLQTSAAIEGRLSDQGLILDLAFKKVSHTTCGSGDGGTVCLPDEWAFESVHLFYPVDELDAVSIQHTAEFTVMLIREYPKSGAPQ
jgi:hypothetical protein